MKQQQKPQQPTTPDSLFAQMILFQKNKKNKSELELEQIPKWNPDTFIDSSTLDKNLESIWNALKFAVPSLPSSGKIYHSNIPVKPIKNSIKTPSKIFSDNNLHLLIGNPMYICYKIPKTTYWFKNR